MEDSLKDNIQKMKSKFELMGIMGRMNRLNSYSDLTFKSYKDEHSGWVIEQATWMHEKTNKRRKLQIGSNSKSIGFSIIEYGGDDRKIEFRLFENGEKELLNLLERRNEEKINDFINYAMRHTYCKRMWVDDKLFKKDN